MSKDMLEELIGQALGGKARILGMGEVSGRRAEDYGVTIMPEAQIEELKAAAARYTAPCPFVPGQVVSPRPGYGTRGVNQPHVVLEVRRDAECDMTDHDGMSNSAAFGRRLDMRVSCYVDNETIRHFWCESFEYEEYNPE